MKKIDEVILKETTYIGIWTLIFSVLMQAVFLIIHRWDYTVLLGNLLTGTAAVLNFFLMGLTVQKVLGKEEKEAKSAMRVSQIYRNLLLLIILVLGVVLPCFHTWAAVIAVFFPRIAIIFRPLFDRKGKYRS